jgi:hypothetical protein
VLRIELRRSAALWTGLLVLVIGLGMFYFGRAPWNKGSSAWFIEWTSLARWQRFQLTLMWPFALAAGAWQGRRDRRSKMDELLGTVPMPLTRRVLSPVGAMCIGLTGAYLVMFGVGAVRVLGNAEYHHLGWLPIAVVGLLSLIAAALLGMGLGRVFPYLLTAPVLAVVSLAGLIVLQGTPEDGSVLSGLVTQAQSLLSPSLIAVHDAFTTVAPRVNLLQAMWFVALAATGFGLLTATGRRGRALALIPAVAAAAIALPFLPTRQAEAYVQDADAAALVCAPGTPRVCVTRAHQASLDALVTPAREALTQLARLPYGPNAVEEDTATWTLVRRAQPLETVLLNFDYDSIRNIRVTILAGPDLWCRVEWETNLSIQATRTVVVSWFDGELRPLPGSQSYRTEIMQQAEALWQSLRQLPAAEQAARVAQLRKQTSSCPS